MKYFFSKSGRNSSGETTLIRHSIRTKILLLAFAAAVPFLIVAIYLLISMAEYSHTYEKIVNNLTIANNYNLNFKDEMDESLYKLVVGYVKFDHISEENTLKDPYELIDELRSDFTELKNITTETESKLWLESLLRNIDTLENSVDDIVKSVAAGAQYDRNIEKLDNNIYILTELIQDDIQYYIYYQTKSMGNTNAQLNQQVRSFIIICGILLGILALAIATLAIFLASGMIKPIRELYSATKSVSGGDFSARADVNSHDEIEVLADGFNEMSGNMQLLIKQIKEDEQKMRKADLRLLQEQINPHFLYNTLDTIVWLIESEENDQAVDMVVTLSDFFRLVLSKGKEFISIGQEELHIKSYLEIQETRYHDILEYEIQIDPELHEYQILKLTLQPLVENALYHGIKYKRSKGNIKITGEKKENIICLQVRDDGVGMYEQELQLLREEIERPCRETEKGFGLANVNERIHMYFGMEYGLSIESEKGSGTTVQVKIPAIKTEGIPKNEVANR